MKPSGELAAAAVRPRRPPRPAPATAWVPPARDGVGASCVALPPGDWPTVLEFLAWRLPMVSADDWRMRLAHGEVRDESGQPVAVTAAYRPSTRLWYWRTLALEAEVPFEAEILYRDEHLLVVDKPHFLPMVPKGRYARHTLLARLTRELGLPSLTPIHRLDRETAGVVMFSVRPDSRNAYHALFRERQVQKQYEALAPWRADLDWPVDRSSRLEPSANFMQVHEVAGIPNAQTRIELVEHDSLHARYRLTPLTGQTHQLRVHMHALGVPIYGDTIYPTLQPAPAPGEPPDYSRPLQLLAASIAFQDPLTGEARAFESRRRLRLTAEIAR